jgi:hypothetical protein
LTQPFIKRADKRADELISASTEKREKRKTNSGRQSLCVELLDLPVRKAPRRSCWTD